MPTYDFRCLGCGGVEVDVICGSSELEGRMCSGCGGDVRMVPAFQIVKPGPDVFERTLNDKPVKESKWI